jgi:ubiquinol-cytochrome c reductase cytochrome b subunit
VHDIFGVSVFLMAFTAIMFFAPEFGGYFLEYNNFIPADPLKTPLAHCAVWYFTPFYSMLRAITSEMMYVLIAVVVCWAAVWVCQGKMPAPLQGWRRWWCGGHFSHDAVHRCQVLGCGGDGWCRHHPVLPALAGFQPGQVDSLPPDWHKYLYAVFVINFLFLGYLGVQAAVAPLVSGFAGGHAVLLRLLPADAMVEPYWEVQASADRVTFAAH